jgi:hypothetical protein
LKAGIWRHWYTTLNQMMSELNSETRALIRVSALPGRVSVAGDWFLAVPAYAAAPDVGLRVIKLFSTRDAELDRLKRGVGLPTRLTFYKPETRSALVDRPGVTDPRPGALTVSPYFSLHSDDLTSILENAFRRSMFECYHRQTGVLTAHLECILDFQEVDEPAARAEIAARFRLLQERLAFVHHDSCSQCEFDGRKRRQKASAQR